MQGPAGPFQKTNVTSFLHHPPRCQDAACYENASLPTLFQATTPANVFATFTKPCANQLLHDDGLEYLEERTTFLLSQ